MKHIKKISNVDVYAFIETRTNDTDFFKSSYISNILLFKSEVNVVDFFIKYLNKNHGCNFEPMKDNDGNRLFIKVSENKDYKKALKYCKDNLNNRFYIEEIKYSDDNYDDLIN